MRAELVRAINLAAVIISVINLLGYGDVMDVIVKITTFITIVVCLFAFFLSFKKQ